MTVETVKTPFRIQPTFSYLRNEECESFLSAAQAMIDRIIPETYWLEIGGEVSRDALLAAFYRFNRQIPLIEYSTIAEGAGGMIIRILCQSEYSSGVERYVSDTFSRWLVPWKVLHSGGSLSIDFTFAENPVKRYFFRQEFFRFTLESDLIYALKNMPHLMEEIRVNILAVHHARYIASMKSLPLDQRNVILQENIASLFRSPVLKNDRSTFERMQQFLLKLSEDEKLDQIKKNLSHLLHRHEDNFDPNLFSEMTAFIALLNDRFITVRDHRHVSRLIALYYLFKKNLFQAVKNRPDERHLSLKLMKLRMNSDLTIGILAGMNFIKETERFDKKHIIRALQHCLNVSIVSDSFIADRREEKLRIFYFEIQKNDPTPWSAKEIRRLQSELPALLKQQVENIIHPIFLPRNEEEVLRNIVSLSKQIKFLRDLPHLTIHYEKQTDSEISFLIVVVRLLKENDLPLKELLERSELQIRLVVDEIRSAGSLKSKYPKEAAIFRAILDKSQFMRNDYSLDLKRARQKITAELRQLLGDFRDFNGGMIHKQDEALEHLRKIIPSDHEILLENFFYSLRPGIMQTVHPPEILKIFFGLLLDALKETNGSKGYHLKFATEGKYFFAMITAKSPAFKEEVQSAIAKLKIPSYDLTTTFLTMEEWAAKGYIYRTDDAEKRVLFQQTLRSCLEIK